MENDSSMTMHGPSLGIGIKANLYMGFGFLGRPLGIIFVFLNIPAPNLTLHHSNDTHPYLLFSIYNLGLEKTNCHAFSFFLKVLLSRVIRASNFYVVME